MLQFILHSHPAAPQQRLHTIHHRRLRLRLRMEQEEGGTNDIPTVQLLLVLRPPLLVTATAKAFWPAKTKPRASKNKTSAWRPAAQRAPIDRGPWADGQRREEENKQVENRESHETRARDG